jgi:hypothetical protein
LDLARSHGPYLIINAGTAAKASAIKPRTEVAQEYGRVSYTKYGPEIVRNPHNSLASLVLHALFTAKGNPADTTFRRKDCEAMTEDAYSGYESLRTLKDAS